MSIDFHNANNALRFLEGKGITTAQGRVFLASDVEAAVRLDEEARTGRASAPQPKTMVQAKRLIRENTELMDSMKNQQIDPAATHPLSRT